MKPCALFSVFTKYSYCHVHRFADNERMELTALCSSSPLLVMMQDTSPSSDRIRTRICLDNYARGRIFRSSRSHNYLRL